MHKITAKASCGGQKKKQKQTLEDSPLFVRGKSHFQSAFLQGQHFLSTSIWTPFRSFSLVLGWSWPGYQSQRLPGSLGMCDSRSQLMQDEEGIKLSRLTHTDAHARTHKKLHSGSQTAKRICVGVDLRCSFTSRSPLVIQASSTRNWRSSTFLFNRKKHLDLLLSIHAIRNSYPLNPIGLQRYAATITHVKSIQTSS